MGPEGKSGWREVQLAGAPGTPPVPWIVTNPVDAPAPPARTTALPAPGGSPIDTEWRIEKDGSSTGTVDVAGDGSVAVAYELDGGGRASQFVALAGDLREKTAAEHIVFAGRAAGPMRVSVQLRFPGAERRWVKSVYLDANRRTIAVPVGEMRPAELDGGAMPDPSTARSLLFVVDLTNAIPGSRGSFTLSGIRLGSR
jgi:hypothetical protein